MRGSMKHELDSLPSAERLSDAAYRAVLEALFDRRVAAGAFISQGELSRITGCPVGGVINKIGRTIESNGGVVVCMDDCSGERTAAMMVDPDAPDAETAGEPSFTEPA